MLNFKEFDYQRFKSILFCWLFLICFVGCAAPPLDLSLAPSADMVVASGVRPAQGTIGVSPFVDERPIRHGSDNTKWKGLIPGVLWLEISSDIPETYTPFSHYEAKPLDRVTTRACIDLLKQSALFTQVVDLHTRPDARTDYRLQGVLYQTMVKETGYYYGSCIYAWLVRILGLPYVSFEIDYHIGFSVIDTASGEVVWISDIKGNRVDKFYSVYSISRGREGKHVIAWNIADILAEEFNNQIDSFEQAVSRF